MSWDVLPDAILRWGHILAAILWLGTFLSVAFVQGPAYRKLEPAVRRQVVLQAMPRALWWVRWASMATLVLGLVLFWWVYMHIGSTSDVSHNPNFKNPGPGGGVTDRALWIMCAMTFATVMWANVWFVIWPTWQRILRSLAGGAAPAPADEKTARIAARFNIFLAGPMLFTMVAPPHLGTFSYLALLVVIVVGAGVMHVLERVAGRIGYAP